MKKRLRSSSRNSAPEPYIEVSMAKETRRKCAYPPCRKTFHPKRYWQKFHSKACALADWKAHHPTVLVKNPFK